MNKVVFKICTFENKKMFSFIYLFFIVVQVWLSPSSPQHAPHSTHPFLPPLNPFGFVHVSFMDAPWWPLSYYPLSPIILLPFLSGYYQFVQNTTRDIENV